MRSAEDYFTVSIGEEDGAHLRKCLGDLHEDDASVTSLAGGERHEELGDERDPVPGRDLALVVIECL